MTIRLFLIMLFAVFGAVVSAQPGLTTIESSCHVCITGQEIIVTGSGFQPNKNFVLKVWNVGNFLICQSDAAGALMCAPIAFSLPGPRALQIYDANGNSPKSSQIVVEVL